MKNFQIISRITIFLSVSVLCTCLFREEEIPSQFPRDSTSAKADSLDLEEGDNTDSAYLAQQRVIDSLQRLVEQQRTLDSLQRLVDQKRIIDSLERILEGEDDPADRADSADTPAPELPPANDSVKTKDTPDVKDLEDNWESLFIESQSEIPSDKFKAFYFEDSAKVLKYFSSETPFPSLNYAYNEFHNIPSKRFMGYWIGNFDFDQTTVQEIHISQSWSVTRIYVDKQKIYEGGRNKTLVHTFSEGTHKIEIEYENNWHTVNFNVGFKTVSPQGPDDSTKAVVDTSQGSEYWVAGVYESGNRDNSVKVVLKETAKPVVLFLTSYEVVHWDLSGNSNLQNVAAVYVDSYAPQSTVRGLPSTVPVDYKMKIPYSYKLLATCYAASAHCEAPKFKQMVEAIQKALNVTPTSYFGDYNPGFVTLPDIQLDAAAYEKIFAEIDSLEGVHKKSTIGDVFKGDTGLTWQSRFINASTEIPLDKFKAFYFDDKHLEKPAVTGEVDFPEVEFIYDRASHGIHAQDFSAYWVGNFTYSQPVTKVFKVTQGHAETRIFIDKKEIYSGTSNKSIDHTFQAGTHLVEIQHVNNWHTIKYSVLLEDN